MRSTSTDFEQKEKKAAQGDSEECGHIHERNFQAVMLPVKGVHAPVALPQGTVPVPARGTSDPMPHNSPWFINNGSSFLVEAITQIHILSIKKKRFIEPFEILEVRTAHQHGSPTDPIDTAGFGVAAAGL